MLLQTPGAIAKQAQNVIDSFQDMVNNIIFDAPESFFLLMIPMIDVYYGMIVMLGNKLEQNT